MDVWMYGCTECMDTWILGYFDTDKRSIRRYRHKQARMYACTHVYISAYQHISISAHVYAHMHICTYVHDVHMYICMYMHSYCVAACVHTSKTSDHLIICGILI